MLKTYDREALTAPELFTLDDSVPDPPQEEVALRALFENTTAGIAEIDAATGRFLIVNRRYCQMTGRTAAELLGGLCVSDVLHPDNDRVAVEVAEAHGQTERRYLQPNGQVTWVRISVAVTARDAAGAALRISAIVQDVTDSHIAREKLRASESLLRLSLEIGRVGCFTRDLVTGDIQCGPETRSMHGLPPGDQPIPASIWLDTVLPEDRENLLAPMSLAITECLPEANFQYRFRHPATGQVRHIEVRTRYDYDARGRPIASVGAIIDVTERHEAQAKITHLAFHDTLTGFPNRTMFRQSLEAALRHARRGREIAVLYLDLDRFKEVNDMYGHSAGDGLLRDVAARLQADMDQSTSIARLGGDEFAIIQQGGDQPARAIALATRLVEAMRPAFLVDWHRIEIGTSIGIAIAPDDGDGPEKILAAADLALYDAKAEGRDCFRLYRPALSERAMARRDLERDLRQAVERGEFEVFYQPILDAKSLVVTGMEALLRWRHPVQGLLSPDSFVPLAEELGLIKPIGEWVLAQACADAAVWPRAVRVAVNLSVVQFADRNLISVISSALENSGLVPNRLELEITETVMLKESEANLATLHRIRELGVRIALDDFGTGFSSLSYLRSFPFDKLKVDRSFTRELCHSQQSAAIMRSILGLCAELGITSTVEGVESEEQLQALRQEGCIEVQGFLFGKPGPVDLVPETLARSDVRPRRLDLSAGD